MKGLIVIVYTMIYMVMRKVVVVDGYDCIRFKGGGIYYWWQAGACKYLLEQGRTCIHTYIHTYIQTYIHACIHTYIYIHIHAHTYTH